MLFQLLAFKVSYLKWVLINIKLFAVPKVKSRNRSLQDYCQCLKISPPCARKKSLFSYQPIFIFPKCVFIHSFLLLSSFCRGLPLISTLCASVFSTSYLCNFPFLMTCVACIWYMPCNLEISAHVLAFRNT